MPKAVLCLAASAQNHSSLPAWYVSGGGHKSIPPPFPCKSEAITGMSLVSSLIIALRLLLQGESEKERERERRERKGTLALNRIALLLLQVT